MDNHIFLKTLKRLFSKFFPPNIRIEGGCRQCGKCCQNVILTYNGKIVKSEEDFSRLVDSDPRYSRFRFRALNDDQDMVFICNLLAEDGRCLDYENRLDICKQYPDPRMFLRDGKLLVGCGYKAGDSFAFYLKKAQQKRKSL